MKQRTLGLAISAVVIAAGCSRASPGALDADCGISPGDWCASPPGDPCGAHRDKASCMADARCKGRRYRGESVVSCWYDERDFASNCPTVGCISR